LDIHGVADGAQQPSLRVYQDMALLPVDLFARIKARRVNADPSVSAAFMLWLSMIAAVGLASRSATVRLLPLRLARGIIGPTLALSSSVRSLG
jgi:hypothetical protein